jgi:hypothetical protein
MIAEACAASNETALALALKAAPGGGTDRDSVHVDEFGQTQIKPLRVRVRRFTGQARQIAPEPTQKAGFTGTLTACNGD